MTSAHAMRLIQFLRTASVTTFDFTIVGRQEVCKPKYLLTTDRDYIISLIERDLVTPSVPSYYGPTMRCGSCAYEAPFYLFLPAAKFPGMVRCPECRSDNTVAVTATPADASEELSPGDQK